MNNVANAGTMGTTACMASYLVCNTIFNSIMRIAGETNVRKDAFI